MCFLKLEKQICKKSESSKKNCIDLETLCMDPRIQKKKKKNQSIILKIKMKLEKHIYKKSFY